MTTRSYLLSSSVGGEEEEEIDAGAEGEQA